MKKIISLFLLFCITGIFSATSAVEIKIQGKGIAPLTGYDIKNVRHKQDKHMKKKADNSSVEFIQTQQVKEAARQAETRKKQDERMSNALRRAVVTDAQENALKAALNILIDRTLGAGANKNPQVMEKFDDLLSQADTYILDSSYTGEVKDNNYVATAHLIVDETAFKSLVSDMGIAIITQKVRQSAILIVMDEFFAPPSDLKNSAPTKDITTYKYNNETKYKNTEKENASASAGAGYANWYGAGGYSGKSASSYGKFTDFSNKENEFYQHIVEYAPRTPKVQNMNYTQPSLVNAFSEYDIRAIDNDIFKSKYFKGSPITADKLSNSAQLANYVNYARKEAKVDFFAIGVSYITDNGKNYNTGRNTCDGNVFVKIYSTQDGEVIASGSFTETASGNSADQARAAVAEKIGQELGEELANRIQNYWKKRLMYGSEYVVQVQGKFLPAERIAINQAIKKAEGIQTVTLRSSDSTKSEFVVNYKGTEAAGDVIFTGLMQSPLSAKFSRYDYKISGNQIIFSPLNGKGIPNL